MAQIASGFAFEGKTQAEEQKRANEWEVYQRHQAGQQLAGGGGMAQVVRELVGVVDCQMTHRPCYFVHCQVVAAQVAVMALAAQDGVEGGAMARFLRCRRPRIPQVAGSKMPSNSEWVHSVP